MLQTNELPSTPSGEYLDAQCAVADALARILPKAWTVAFAKPGDDPHAIGGEMIGHARSIGQECDCCLVLLTRPSGIEFHEVGVTRH